MAAYLDLASARRAVSRSGDGSGSSGSSSVSGTHTSDQDALSLNAYFTVKPHVPSFVVSSAGVLPGSLPTERKFRVIQANSSRDLLLALVVIGRGLDTRRTPRPPVGL